METKYTTEDIAVSFINGNLSWVKEQCKKDLSQIGRVIAELDEISTEERERFTNWLMTW